MVKRSLRSWTERNGLLSVLYNAPRLLKGYQPVFLDYPVRPVPRYGYGKPAHAELSAILAASEGAYAGNIRAFLAHADALLRILVQEQPGSSEPCWRNKWLEGLDTLALYGFVAARRPARYIEVGSGYSTRVVRRAIRDGGLATKLISIDPQPRAEINALCDQVVRQPLERCDLNVFEHLEKGDILFVDSSHRSFMNSDVTVFFLEILPRLKPGVLVHLHDIYLPLDYPPERAHWYYSEQYLLAASLLAGHAGYRVVFPAQYVDRTPQLASTLDPFWDRLGVAGLSRAGTSFWVEIV